MTQCQVTDSRFATNLIGSTFVHSLAVRGGSNVNWESGQKPLVSTGAVTSALDQTKAYVSERYDDVLRRLAK